jgi:hypothetical protein
MNSSKTLAPSLNLQESSDDVTVVINDCNFDKIQASVRVKNLLFTTELMSIFLVSNLS